MNEQNNSAAPEAAVTQPQAADSTATQAAPVAAQAPAGGTQALATKGTPDIALEVRCKGITVQRGGNTERLEDIFIEIVDCKRSCKEHPRYPLNDIGIALKMGNGPPTMGLRWSTLKH